MSAVFEFHGDDQVDSYTAVISEGKYRLIATDTILLESNGHGITNNIPADFNPRPKTNPTPAH